mmetsp:Transcript_103817/g.290708  ORF Transcript_103817/g.290708 Transcript_103817/m.290708 type:complete len:238 (-) Transcript_103817:283-996(-)
MKPAPRLTSPAMVALLSDLRGVTVRNTFLEFDTEYDDLIPESGLARQASEPAKPFHRHAFEQSSAGSCATFADASTDHDDDFPPLCSTAPSHSGSASGAGAPCFGPLVGIPRPAPGGYNAGPATVNPAAAFQAPAASPPVMRFCPNCGAKAEPGHRFCPYCCFRLQQPQQQCATAEGYAAGPPAALGWQPCPAALETNADRLSFLSALRRFRYVEASGADIDRANALCMSLVGHCPQ